MNNDYPQLLGRTRRFSIGMPRDFTISPNGRAVIFLRSQSGTNPAQSLWRLDVDTGEETLLVDPQSLDTGDGDVPAEVLQMQQRQRNLAAGIIGYAADESLTKVVFGLNADLWLFDIADNKATKLPAASGAVDPKFSPDGRYISYVSAGALHVIDSHLDRRLAAPEGPDVTYGLPDFNAAEDMGQSTGYWWDPEGDRLLVTRVDNSDLELRSLPGDGDPAATPRSQRYPVVGGANPQISLSIVSLDGDSVPVDWLGAPGDYLVNAHWSRHGLLLTTLNRAQNRLRLLKVTADTGAVQLLRTDSDRQWVYPINGVPAYTADGRLVYAAEHSGAYRLLIDDEAVTGDDIQVKQVCGVDAETVLFTACSGGNQIQLWSWCPESGLRLQTPEPGVHTGHIRGGTILTVSGTMETPFSVRVRPADAEPVAITIDTPTPDFKPRVSFLLNDEPAIRTAVVLPSWYVPGEQSLPVLMDPYGGPGAQRVLATQRAYWTSQWFADHGFAVVIADGRGTPGLGPQWDRTVHLRQVDTTVEDQVAALHAASERFDDLDLTKVGIRGWSYGGTLAAAAVLRRGDVFHAASSGAPSLDALLYSTYYTERYFGHPDAHPEVYQSECVIKDAAGLTGKLLLIHGLADDNVHPANTLRMSRELLRERRDHEVLLLPDETHVPIDATTLENLLWHELRFLKRSLRLES